jgi:hypothetical protein
VTKIRLQWILEKQIAEMRTLRRIVDKMRLDHARCFNVRYHCGIQETGEWVNKRN